MQNRRKSIQKINLVTLGCSKNLVDSEHLARQIVANGIEILHDSDSYDAKTVIINTCGFIQDAKEESIQSILGFARARQQGLIDNLYVMGCLSERYKDVLQKEIGEVDAYFGVNSLEKIIDSLKLDFRKELLGERQLSTPSHYAYLKVSEGCDRTCSFCAIPLIRGKHISRPLHELAGEATFLASKGVKELILIAQDLTYYGRDLAGGSQLAALLETLTAIDGIEWIRLHYAYPAAFPFEILPIIHANPKICKYVDLPFQHASDHMLRMMRRNITGQESRRLLNRIREEVPGIALRTTLMTGHPGESEKDFEALCDLVREARFDRLGVFSYSHEEDTYAWKNYTDIIPEPVKEQRRGSLLAIQEKISKELNESKLGKVFKVIIDGMEGPFYLGRTEYDSPEVDNEIHIPLELAQWKPGTFQKVIITEASAYEMLGIPAGE